MNIKCLGKCSFFSSFTATLWGTCRACAKQLLVHRDTRILILFIQMTMTIIILCKISRALLIANSFLSLSEPRKWKIFKVKGSKIQVLQPLTFY
jgi:hypothetical protein